MTDTLTTHAGEQQLLAYSYRMLGSVREAEPLVRDAMRAGSPEARYRAATQACLTAPRRPLPTSLAAATDNPEGKLTERREVPWLEPIPAALLGAEPPGSVDLGLIAALQSVPPPQRAAVVLRDVLSWPADDAARVLGSTPSEVNRAVEQARALLTVPQTGVPPDERALLEAYVRAFEDYDLLLLTEVFTPDAIWEMPPFLTWVRGALNIQRLIARHCPAKGPGDQFLVPTTANFQPAFGLYMRNDDGTYRAFNLQVLSLTAAGVAHAVAFFDLSLFETFNLPDLIASAADVPGGESQQMRYNRRKR